MELVRVSFNVNGNLVADIAEMAAAEGQTFDHVLIRCIIEGRDSWIRRNEQIGRQGNDVEGEFVVVPSC